MLPLLLTALSLGAGDAAPPLNSLELLQTPPGEETVGRVPRNTPMVVEFWATWCGPCVEQIPRWNALAQKFRGRVQFVAVTAEDPETVAGFLLKRPMAGWVALDLDGAAHESYGVEAVPRAFVVDARGVVRAATSLSTLRDSDLEALIAGRELEARQPPSPG